MATKIFELLHKKFEDKSGLVEAALSAYETSTSYADSEWKVKNLLSKFARLDDEQVTRVVLAFNGNSQNSNSWKGRDQLMLLLGGWSNKSWDMRNGELIEKTVLSEDIPF